MDTLEQQDQRLAMMSKMLRATNADTNKVSSIGKLGCYNTLVSHCLDCHSPEICEAWLEQEPSNVKAPGFCPNAKLFNSM